MACATGQVQDDIGKAVTLVGLGVFFCLGCYGVRWMLKGINSSVVLREDGLTGRNVWGREVYAAWPQVSRVRSLMYCDDRSDSSFFPAPFDVYQVRTEVGDIYFDSTFPGHEELDREIRLKSGAESEGMSWLEALFMTHSALFNLIVLATCAVAAVVVSSF
jgi:hypothetical protein